MTWIQSAEGIVGYDASVNRLFHFKNSLRFVKLIYVVHLRTENIILSKFCLYGQFLSIIFKIIFFRLIEVGIL